jgi:hypothetical protein
VIDPIIPREPPIGNGPGAWQSLRHGRASFETRPSGAPQDEVDFVDRTKENPHPEEAVQRPSRRTHGVDPRLF